MHAIVRILAVASAAALAACAADDVPLQPRSVDDLRACIRDEVNEGRGTAHPSVLGELAAAHCADEIFRFAKAEQARGEGGAEPDRIRDRARQLEAELRAYGLRYALGLEG